MRRTQEFRHSVSNFSLHCPKIYTGKPLSNGSKWSFSPYQYCLRGVFDLSYFKDAEVSYSRSVVININFHRAVFVCMVSMKSFDDVLFSDLQSSLQSIFLIGNKYFHVEYFFSVYRLQRDLFYSSLTTLWLPVSVGSIWWAGYLGTFYGLTKKYDD